MRGLKYILSLALLFPALFAGAQTISFTSTVSEGQETTTQIDVTLSGATFEDPLTTSEWSITTSGISVKPGSVVRVDDTHAYFYLNSTLNDYDSDLTYSLKVKNSQTTYTADIFSDLTLHALIESISISTDNVNEGSENTKNIAVTLTNDVFDDPLVKTNWFLVGAPAGVSISAVSRTDNTHATISLNVRTVDYDVSKVAGVRANPGEFVHNSTTSLTSNNAFTFTASDDAESITLTGSAAEGNEGGSIVTVTLANGTFQDPLNLGDFSISNQPQGVTLGSVDRTSSTVAELTLSGDARWDYDINKNLSVTLDTSGFNDNTSDSDLSASTGFTFTATSSTESIAISLDGQTVTEGSENGKYIKVTITNADFRDPVTTSDFDVKGLPSGVTIGSVTRISDSEVHLVLSGNRDKDYDSNITGLSVTVKPSGFYDSSGDSGLTDSDGFVFTAVVDAETAALSGSVTEGNESSGHAILTLSGGTFQNPLYTSDFTISNLPQGVTVLSVTWQNSTVAHINFGSNRTRDYDSNPGTPSVTIDTSAFDDNTSNVAINATSSFAFNFVNDAEDINLYGSASEGAEDGDYVIVKIVGGTFRSGLSASDFYIPSPHEGISPGTVVRKDDTTAWIYLTGNSTLDYDQDITDLQVTLHATGYDDSNTGGGDRIASTGFTFLANKDAETITISGSAAEGSENGAVITVNLSGGQFKTLPDLDKNDFDLTNEPAGVSIGSINRISDTQVQLILSGNRTVDYDANITGMVVTLLASGYEDADGANVLSNGTGFTFTANDDKEVIQISGSANEGSEHLGVIGVKLTGGTFKNTFTGTWTATNRPQNVSLGTPIRVDEDSAYIPLVGDRTRDYDVSITNLVLTVPQIDVSDAAGQAPQLTASGFTFNATDDQEVISISGTANEGSEHLATISVSITGGTFKNPLSGTWQVDNLPDGVLKGTITRASDTLATIALTGDRSYDYDGNLTNLSVTVPLTTIDDTAGTAPVLTDNYGFTFQANDDQEHISISGSATEGAENGVLVNVSLAGGTFANPLTGSWELGNLPQGVSQGTVTRTGNTTATIALVGNRTKDYDTSFTHVALTVPAIDVLDPAGTLPSILTTNTGFTFTAVYENPVFTVTDNGSMPEGLQNGKFYTLTVQEDTFALALVDTNTIKLTGQPLGVLIQSANWINKNQVNVFLRGNSVEDFDTDITGNIVIHPTALVQHNGNTYNPSCIYPAINDAESITAAWAPNPGTNGQEATLNQDTLVVSITGGTFNPSTLAANVSLSGSALNYGVTKKSVSAITRQSFKLALAWNGTDFDSNLKLRVAVAPAGYKDPYPGNPVLKDSVTLTAFDDMESIQLSYSTARATFGMEKRLKGEKIHVGITGGSFQHSPDKVTGHVTLSGTAVIDAHVSLGSITGITASGFDIVLNWDGTDFDLNKSLTISIDTSAFKDAIAPVSSSLVVPATIEKATLTPSSISENSIKLGDEDLFLTLHGATWKASSYSSGYYKPDTVATLLSGLAFKAGSTNQIEKLVTDLLAYKTGNAPNDTNKAVWRMNDTILKIDLPGTMAFEINEASRFSWTVPKQMVDSTKGAIQQPNDLDVYESPSTSATLFGISNICADGSMAPMTVVLTGNAEFGYQLRVLRDGNFFANYSTNQSVFVFNTSEAGTYTIDSLINGPFRVGSPNVKITGSVTLTVHPLPTGVAITGLNPVYAVSNNAVPLTGTKTGGVFYGPYVNTQTNLFYPVSADTIEIVYRYTDVNQCSNYDTAQVIILAGQASITFNKGRSIYCSTETEAKVSGTNSSGYDGWFSLKNYPLALSPDGPDPDAVKINPSLIVGSDSLYYNYTIGTKTLNIAEKITVEGPKDFSFDSELNTRLCQEDPAEPYIKLSGTERTNIRFYGSGVTGNAIDGYRFYPDSVAAGTHPVYYQYVGTTAAQCTTTISKDLQVFEVPKVNFTLQDSCITGDPDDFTWFRNTTNKPDLVQDWEWSFGDNYANVTDNKSSDFEPGHLYRWNLKKTEAAGNKTVTLSAVSKPEHNGCLASVTRVIRIGMIPKEANFSWDNVCFQPGESIRFAVNSGSGSESETNDTSFTWSVFTPGTVDSIVYKGKTRDIIFSTLASHRVDLLYKTNFGCRFTRRDTINLRPTILLEDEYYSDFENGKNGWFAEIIPDTATINSWTFGTPDNTGLNYAASGINAWYTKITSRKQAEQTAVSGPCFDFSKMKNPMISLDIWRSLSNQRDGAMLQYSTDPEGLEWNTIGTTNEAVNWYTEFQILGFPDNKTIGWSGGVPDAGWVTARHWLDLAGKPNVRLRIVYGSDGSSLSQNEGFAFDNIWIGEK
ncbi:MAG: hypothetical protein U0T82_15710, partial [Bacteroidales bacterium]